MLLLVLTVFSNYRLLLAVWVPKRRSLSLLLLVPNHRSLFLLLLLLVPVPTTQNPLKVSEFVRCLLKSSEVKVVHNIIFIFIYFVVSVDNSASANTTATAITASSNNNRRAFKCGKCSFGAAKDECLRCKNRIGGADMPALVCSSCSMMSKDKCAVSLLVV